MNHELYLKHVGETIFVIGSGPSLGSYDSDLLSRLGEQICIGVNRTQYKIKLSYFISSYLSEILLALKRCPGIYAIHTRPVLEAPLAPGIRTVRRVFTDDPNDLVLRLLKEDPVLITRNNVSFLATHLAFIMGAKKIVYVGCEQRNEIHFYNEDDALMREIIIDLCGIISGHHSLLGKDHPYENPFDMMSLVTRPSDVLRAKSFGPIDHSDLLARWIERLRTVFDVEVFCCAPDSVFIDAGATFIGLEQALLLPCP